MQADPSYLRRRSSFPTRRWSPLILLLLLFGTAAFAETLTTGVDAIGMTVTALDGSVAFYRDVLDFEPVSEAEVAGAEYGKILGVFGLRLRVARMRLGDEYIELMQFPAPGAGRSRWTRAATTTGSSISPTSSAKWSMPIRGCAGTR